MALDDRTKRDLRDATNGVQVAYQLRDTVIRRAIDAGGSYREIADVTGLSKSTIANIANRETDR